MTNEKLLDYDIVASSMLFESNGFMTKPNKSKLITELEKHLTPDDCKFSFKNISASIVDVMNVVRKLPTSVSTFAEFITNFMKTSYERNGRCDYVFDIYDDEPSVKYSEKQRRINKAPIHLSTIQTSTPFPKEVDSFWSSNQNKLKLQKLIYQEVQKHNSKYTIVLGSSKTHLVIGSV